MHVALAHACVPWIEDAVPDGADFVYALASTGVLVDCFGCKWMCPRHCVDLLLLDKYEEPEGQMGFYAAAAPVGTPVRAPLPQFSQPGVCLPTSAASSHYFTADFHTRAIGAKLRPRHLRSSARRLNRTRRFAAPRTAMPGNECVMNNVNMIM